MPRSFLVRQHRDSDRKPNYSRLQGFSPQFTSQQLDKWAQPPAAIAPPDVTKPMASLPALIWDAVGSSLAQPSSPQPQERPKAAELTSQPRGPPPTAPAFSASTSSVDPEACTAFLGLGLLPKWLVEPPTAEDLSAGTSHTHLCSCPTLASSASPTPTAAAP